MSFPRAKIHRFNEPTGCTPAPGSYNPKFDDKIIGTGAFIEKSERFVEVKSHGVASTDLNASFTSGHIKASSLSHLPTFRTPQVPQNLQRTASNSKLNGARNVSKVLHAESLDSLHVARNSKEDCIQELEHLMVQLNETIRDKEAELVKIQAERDAEKLELSEKIVAGEQELATSVAASTVQIAEKQVELDQAEGALREKNARIKCLEIRCLEQEADLQKLLEKVDRDLKDQMDLSQKFGLQISDLETLIAEKDSLVQELFAMLSEQHASGPMSISARLESLLEETEVLERVQVELRQQVAVLEQMNAVQKCQIDHLHKNVLELDAELLHETSMQEDAITRLKDENFLLTNSVEEQKNMLSEKQQALLALELKLDECLEKIAIMQKDFEQVDKEQRITIEQMNQSLSEYVEKETDLQQKVAEKQNMILMLQGELSEKEVQLEEVSADYARAVSQIMVDTDLRAEVTKYSQCIDFMKKSQAQQDADNMEKYKMLQDNILNGSMLRSDLESALTSTQSELDDLKAQYNALSLDAKAELERTLEDAGKKQNEIIFELLETRSKLRLAECDLEEVQSLLAKVKLEGHYIYATLTTEAAALMMHRDELRICNVDYQLSIVDLQDKVDVLTVELGATVKYHSDETARIRSELQESRSQCKRFEIGNVNLHESLEAVTQRLTESIVDLREQAQVIEKSKQVISVLEKDLVDQKLVTEQCFAWLEAENLRDIEELRSTLTSKVMKLEAKIKDCEVEKEQFHEAFEHFGTELQKMTKAFAELLEENTAAGQVFAELQQAHSTLQESFKTQGRDLYETKFDLLAMKSDVESKEMKMESLARQHETMLASHEADKDRVINYIKSILLKLKESSVDELTGEALTAIEKLEHALCEGKDVEQKMEEFNAILCFKRSDNRAEENEKSSAQKVELESVKRELASLSGNFLNVQKQVAALEVDNEEKDKLNQEMTKELSMQSKTLTDANTLIMTLTKQLAEEKKVTLEFGDAVVELKCGLEDHKKQVADLRDELDRTSGLLRAELETKACQTQELEKAAVWEERYQQLVVLVGPFREQLEEFEVERQALELRKEAADNEVKDLSDKYAHILGHQNHKQKIHHVVKLKERNLQLKQEVEKYETELRAKDKLIRKLKSEAASVTRKPLPSAKSLLSAATLVTKGKENGDHSPARQSPNPKPFRELANC